MLRFKKIQKKIIHAAEIWWSEYKEQSVFRRIIKLSILGFIIATFLGAYAFIQSVNLPTINTLIEYEPRVVTTVYDQNDKVIAEYSSEQRIELKEKEIPEIIKKAFIAAEDDEFYRHKGINPLTLLRAAVKNFIAGSKVQGGSTITQQVAKTFFLSPEKSYSRKIKELFLAIEIEKKLTKDQILNRYLNQIYLGQGTYGIESASLIYFGKHAKDISLGEAAILGGLPRSPSRENPISNPIACRSRQRYVLKRMKEVGFISDSEYQKALNEDIKVKNKVKEIRWPSPYFSEYVRRYLLEKYGKKGLYEEGLKVYTTIDSEAQVSAQKAVDNGLEKVDKRMGFRKPQQNFPTEITRQAFLNESHKKIVEETYDFKFLKPDGKLNSPVDAKDITPLKQGETYPALVMGKDKARKNILVQVGNKNGSITSANYQWTREANPTEIYKEKIIRDPFRELSVGDLIDVKYLGGENFALDQKPLVQGSLISYRLPDGAIHSMVGGYNFYSTRSEFNRATQAVRQPGSTFKPIIYGAALEKGVTPASIIVDSPIVYKDTSEKDELEKSWRPDNYGSVSYGDTSLRSALAHSRNIPTIKLLQYIKVQTAIDFARKLGIKGKLNNDLTLALGSSGITLDELTNAISVFANQGKKTSSYFIRKIENRNGETIEEHQDLVPEQIISPQIAFLVSSLMRSVIDFGTGVSIKALGRPVAGKTGTTSDYKDALFVGFIPQMITSVWVGFDENQQVGPAETGTRAAAPIWLEYMNSTTKDMQIQDFAVPEGISQVTVDAETGNIPTSRSKKIISEYFIEGTAPGQKRTLPNGEISTEINKPMIITGYGPTLNPDTQATHDNSATDAEVESGGDAIRNDF
jgi:penicillin-binding protein 1A